MEFKAKIKHVYFSENNVSIDLDFKDIKHEDFGWFHEYVKSGSVLDIQMVPIKE